MNTFEQIDNLSVNEKINYLQTYVGKLPAEEIQKGNAVSDVSYFQTYDGNLGIDISVVDSSGNLSHIYYDVANNQFKSEQSYNDQIALLESNIKNYSIIGADVSDLQRALENDNKMMSSLYNSDKISLNELQKTAYDAYNLGLNADEINFAITIPGEAKIDSDELDKLISDGEEMGLNQKQVVDNLTLTNLGLGISEDALGSDNVNTINGNEGITSNYTFNQLFGENCDQYRILQSSNGQVSLVGIKDGVMHKINDNGLLKSTSPSNKSITMLQGDGSTSDKGVIACFKVNSGSGVNGDQYVGVYMQDGQMRIFYARGGDGNLIGQDISAGSAHSNSRHTTENLLDPARNNDLKPEDKSASKVSSVNQIGAKTAPPNRDSDELIDNIANAYDIPAKELKKQYDANRESTNNRNVNDETLINILAEDIAAEKNKDGNENTYTNEEPKENGNEEENHWPGERVLGGNDHHRPPLF